MKPELAYEILYKGGRKGWWDPIVVEELGGYVPDSSLIAAPSETDS